MKTRTSILFALFTLCLCSAFAGVPYVFNPGGGYTNGQLLNPTVTGGADISGNVTLRGPTRNTNSLNGNYADYNASSEKRTNLTTGNYFLGTNATGLWTNPIAGKGVFIGNDGTVRASDGFIGNLNGTANGNLTNGQGNVNLKTNLTITHTTLGPSPSVQFSYPSDTGYLEYLGGGLFTLSGGSGVLSANGSFLTHLNASQLTGGIVPLAAMPPQVITNYQPNAVVSGIFTVTNVPPSQVAEIDFKFGSEIGSLSFLGSGVFSLGGGSDKLQADGSLFSNIGSNNFDAGTKAQLALAGNTPVNVITQGQSGVTLTNLTTTGVRTNLEVLQYPEPNPRTWTIENYPNPYWMFVAWTGTTADETTVLSIINYIATNGVRYGCNYLLLEAGWGARVGGNLVFNPASFTHTGAYICNYAHTNGVRIGLYINTASGGTLFGQPTSIGFEVADANTVANVFQADGVKSDGVNSQVFISTLYNTTRPMFIQGSVFAPITGYNYAMQPTTTKYYNSIYTGVNLADTDGPYNFTNIIAHFWAEVNNLAYIGPGFLQDGTGWMDNLGTSPVFGSDTYSYPYHVSMDLAAMICSRPRMIAYSGALTWSITNTDYLSILRNPYVVPARTVITNYTSDGKTNYVMVRQQGAVDSGIKALCFLNASANTNSMSISTNRLGINNPVVTLYSPYYHTIEGWQTNGVTVAAVPPTNTILYRVVAGYQGPNLVPGTNYLSDQPWRSTLIAGSGASSISRDARNNGNTLNINGVTFAKGFCMGYGGDGNAVATVAEFSLGKMAQTFTTTFGLDQDWSGNSGLGARLTVYLDGVQAFQSVYIGPTGLAIASTNITLNVAGVGVIKLAVDVNSGSGAGQGNLGGCYVTVVPPTLGDATASSFTNNGLTASRTVLTDVNKALVSAAASGAVPINADGTTSTAAQVVAVLGATPVNRSTGDSAGNSISGTYAPLASPSLTTPTLGNATATSLTNNNLTASRTVLSDANKNLVSAAASGVVPIDADGSATTFPQVNALAPSQIVTNGNSPSLTFSNRFNIETNIGALYIGTNTISGTNTVQVDAQSLNKAFEIGTNGNIGIGGLTINAPNTTFINFASTSAKMQINKLQFTGNGRFGFVGADGWSEWGRDDSGNMARPSDLWVRDYINVANGYVVATNLFTGGVTYSTNGVFSKSRNLLAPVSISVTASPFNWTNSIGTNNIYVFVDGSGVTGSVALNGTTIFSALAGADATIPLQPGEYLTVTYTIGTPVMNWKPF